MQISHYSLTGMLCHSILQQMECHFNPHSKNDPDSGVRTPRSATPEKPAFGITGVSHFNFEWGVSTPINFLL